MGRKTLQKPSAPAGNHQLVAEDLMEDGTISSLPSLARATLYLKG
jgi:hypothetical protein